MSGVWVFKDGVVRLVDNNPKAESSSEGSPQQQGSKTSRKVLVNLPSGEVIISYEALETKLSSLGWERYDGDPDLLQFYKRSTTQLISLPKDFSQFKSIHMYDIAIQNPKQLTVGELSYVV